MPVAIRSASLNDVPAILAIEGQAPGAAHWTSEQYKKLVGSGVVLVAEEEGQLCGFVCAKAVAGEWEIENVVVAAAFLRRGIANGRRPYCSKSASRICQPADCTKNSDFARWATDECITGIRWRTRSCARFDSTGELAQKPRVLHHFLCDFGVASPL